MHHFKHLRDIEAYLIGCYDGIQGTNANGNTFAGGFQYTLNFLDTPAGRSSFCGYICKFA
ncbi:MAG: hypothetical protein IPO26_18045 [Saprospiraceae bacterium]|nr:hypothetical protein [Saprospiraceae bacterium]